jgi:succinoglycan biosynthesis protein ExoA/succinoglycan biosynthesis protein ExoL
VRITYFVIDLSDPAAAQRVRMLRLGGADVRLLGFHRSAAPIHRVEGVAAIDLGRTFERRMWQRTFKVLIRSLGSMRWRDTIRDADVVLARNLEMWTIARAARAWTGSHVPMVYECLDVHSLLSGSGLPSKLLRSWERHVLQGSSALMVSSPGFVRNHFELLGAHLPPRILTENKRVLSDDQPDRSQHVNLDVGPPWRIGWFGNLRCAQSFHILHTLARRHPTLVDIELCGRPSGEIQVLIDRSLPSPNMRFNGPYQQKDLAAMYQACHLTWAIDYYEQGLNSDWLLPNRLYEGGYFNCPPIALAGTETANWLDTRRAGVLLSDTNDALESFVVNLTPARYRDLRHASAAIPTSDLVHSIEDCRRLVARLAGTSN